MPTKEEMKKFAMAIYKLVAETDYDYIEAITEYCKMHELELEIAATLINNNLKAKIQINAMDRNMLKEKNRRLF